MIAVLLSGGLLWLGWSYLTTLPAWGRFAVWLPASAATLFACAWFYRGLWEKRPLFGTRFAVNPDLGPLTDVVLTTVFVWFLLTAPFAYTTYLFEREKLIPLLEKKEDLRRAYYKSTDEYGWQALHVLPFITATETLKWDEPAKKWKEPAADAAAGPAPSPGYSTGTGVLLVIYKILVLAPVLAACRAAWVLRTHKSEMPPARASNGSAADLEPAQESSG